MEKTFHLIKTRELKTNKIAVSKLHLLFNLKKMMMINVSIEIRFIQNLRDNEVKFKC